MKRNIFILLSFAVLLISCDVAKYRVFDSFVTAYYDVEKMELEVTESGNIALLGIGGGIICAWNSKDGQKQLYDSLCSLHQDVGYNTKLEYALGPPGPTYFKGDVVSIDITSDKDYDAQHPVGKTLNDVVRILSISSYEHIRSGYRKSYNWQDDFPSQFNNDSLLLPYKHMQYSVQGYMNSGHPSELYPINKMLSDAVSSDFILMDLLQFYKRGNMIACMMFEKEPETVKQHTFTVVITLSDGRVFSPTVVKIFE